MSDFSQKILDENEEPVKLARSGQEATLKDLLLLALAHPDQSQEEKLPRWISIKHLKQGRDPDFALCKKWVNKVFLSPVVTGRILDALDLMETKEEQKSA